MIVYKVVRRTDEPDVYQSAIIEFPAYVTKYICGETSYPKRKGTLIYAFEDLDFANDFISDYILSDMLCVLECEAETVGYIPRRVFRGGYALSHLDNFSERSSIMRELNRFWKQPYGGMLYSSLTPAGSVWCKWVKPIELVE